MRRGHVSLVAAHALLPAFPAVAVQDGRAATATPVGDRLASVLAQFNGGSANLTEAAIADRRAPPAASPATPAV